MRASRRRSWHGFNRTLVVVAALALSLQPALGPRCLGEQHTTALHALTPWLHGDSRSPPQRERATRTSAPCGSMLACVGAVVPASSSGRDGATTRHCRPGEDIKALASTDRTLDPPPPRA
jgi:hypothetical protein